MDRTSVMWLWQLEKCNQATLEVIALKTTKKKQKSNVCGNKVRMRKMTRSGNRQLNAHDDHKRQIVIIRTNNKHTINEQFARKIVYVGFSHRTHCFSRIIHRLSLLLRRFKFQFSVSFVESRVF